MREYPKSYLEMSPSLTMIDMIQVKLSLSNSKSEIRGGLKTWTYPFLRLFHFYDSPPLQTMTKIHVYSNILYVKEAKAKLSSLAHMAAETGIPV